MSERVLKRTPKDLTKVELRQIHNGQYQWIGNDDYTYSVKQNDRRDAVALAVTPGLIRKTRFPGN